MAKKKSAKKAAKKTVKKAPKKSAKKAAKKQAAPASVVETQPTPVMQAETTTQKADVVVLPPAPAETAKPAAAMPETKSEPAEKHEDFAQALTQEPPKKGFWARLFGK